LNLNCLEDKDESSDLLNLASVKCHVQINWNDFLSFS
jgi:hypothetical protein